MDSTALVGHQLRRCHQVHNALWADAVGGLLTSPQYSVLFTVAAAGQPLDQLSVGRAAGLDRTTVAGVIRRLEEQGWLRRERDAADGRRHLITLPVPAGVALEGLAPAVRTVQERLMAPLSALDRAWLGGRLVDLSGHHDAAGTAGGSGTPGVRQAEDRRPGHLIRLAQQRHTVLWADEVGGIITGPQFAVLLALATSGPTGQGTVGGLAALDRSSASDVLRRLEDRGWTARNPDPDDRRSRLVSLTAAGRSLVGELWPAVERVQERILEPVPGSERGRVVEGLAAVGSPHPAALAPRRGGQ
ncbi:MarR family transcriptional regulator [Citricoccus sp.]|uniref:MarR family winged helix-turn-helix transcriptional regulator n=1 Tax=Citricoccus sp. TaxID=1978372 RepID=UPI0028BD8D80|nr:MarR family transcriptional regulator [Citricoccus sp.]